MSELSRFNWEDLPLQDAIKTVNGNGKRLIATVEDPNCGPCKKLAPQLAKLKDVTIYTFIAPILGDDSITKARNIWCSPDSTKTWQAWMRDNTAIPAVAGCDNPSDRNIALARKLRVMGTPTILFTSGDRIPGQTTAEKIEDNLIAKK